MGMSRAIIYQHFTVERGQKLAVELSVFNWRKTCGEMQSFFMTVERAVQQ